MQSTEDNDNELIKRLELGDRDAFAIIYEKYWSRVYIILLNRIRVSEHTKELVQDIFLDLWNRRGQVHIAKLENYLFSAAKNKMLDYFKRELVRRQHEQFIHATDSDKDCSTEEVLALNALNDVISSFLKALPPKTGKILDLNRFQHKSVAEISNLLNIPGRTVEYHVSIGLSALRAHLKDYLVLILVLMWRL